MSRAGLAALAVAIATGAAAQEVTIGVAPPAGGAVLGRVCVDLDGDGRCDPGEPGVAGARVLQEGGGVATADAWGRFHLLDVPGRQVARDRSAYGTHRVVAEGLGVRRSFELAPGGAAAVDLAVPAPPPPRPPPLAFGAEGSGPVRGPDGRPGWALAGRTAPGAVVTVEGVPVPVSPDGAFAATVPLAPGENRFSVVVVAGASAAVSSGAVHLVPRARGGDLVLPEPPRPLASVSLVPAAGGALAVAELGPRERLRAAGVLSAPGRAAAFAPAGSGEVEIVGGEGAVLARLPLPEARGPRATAVGVAEVEVSFGRGGALVTGRGAAATRGEAGGVRWEAGVDLDDRDERLADLARPRDALAAEHVADPVRSFPTAGDEGASDDRNAARGRVWGRVEAEGARLDLGSTRAGLTGSELGRYDRALFGAKLAADRDAGPVRLQASAFGATQRADSAGNAPPVAAHDVLRATGGAAFWLSHGDVVPGSEAIRVERRDPYSGRLTGQRALVRGVDYELDVVTGRFVLAAPLASVAPPPVLATADPFAAPAVSVIADYLHAAPAGAAEDLQGGRAGASLGPLSLSARAAREVRPGEPGWQLAAGTAVLDLGPLLTLRAEAAHSAGALFGRGGASGLSRSDDGGLRFAPWTAPGVAADALHLEGSGGAGPVRVEGWWRVREGGYSDGEFQEAALARERGARLALGSDRQGAGGSLRWAERRGVDPADPAGLAALESRQLLARAGWQGERLGVAVEGVGARREDAAGTAEATSAGVRGTWRLERGLTLEAAHHQKVTRSGPAVDPTFTSAGATLEHGATSLGVRGGWGPDLGPRVLVSGARRAPGETVYGTFGADPDAPDALAGETSSALGVRQRAGATEVFSEEQFARDVYGLRQSRVLGLGLAPLTGLTLSLSGERGQRLRLDGRIVDRSAAAAAAGWVRGPLRLAARGEVRDEGGDRHHAAGASAEVLVAPGTTVTARVSWTQGQSAGLEGLALDATLGGAWRGDRLSVLGSVSRLVEQRPGAARRDGEVARLALAGDPLARLRLGAGAAVAVQEVAGARDDRFSGSLRAQVRVVGPADVAAEYARRGPLGGGRLGALDAVRAEAGVAVGERAAQGRLAVGYNLFGFGGDGLSPAADTGRLYVRAQLTY